MSSYLWDTRLGRQSSGNTLGVDSVANWTSYFYESAQGAQYVIAPGYFQFVFPYTMVGHAPFGQGNEQDWSGEITGLMPPLSPSVSTSATPMAPPAT